MIGGSADKIQDFVAKQINDLPESSQVNKLIGKDSSGSNIQVPYSALYSLIKSSLDTIYRNIADSYTKTEVDGLVAAGIKEIQPASADDAIAGIKFPTESGTYTNYGGTVVDLTEGLTMIFSDGTGAFTKTVVPIDLQGYATEKSIEILGVHNKNIEPQKNIVKRTDIIRGVYTTAGNISTSSENWICTKKIDCEENTQYTANPIDANGTNRQICFFDEAGAFLSYIATTTSPFTFTTPTGAKKIGANIQNKTGIGLDPLDPSGKGDTFQIEQGSTATEYSDPENLNVLASRVKGIPPEALAKINEEASRLDGKIDSEVPRIDFLMSGFDSIMKFDGTAEGSISEIILNNQGDYIEFFVRLGADFSGYLDGLGLAGKGGIPANVFGFYNSATIWLRQSGGGDYLQFTGLSGLFDFNKIKLEVGIGEWNLYINDVLVGTETKTSSLEINNIGNGYDQTNKAIVDIKYIKINHSGGLEEYNTNADFQSSENIITSYVSKNQIETEYSEVFLTYNPTGFSGNELIRVFVKRKGKNSYTGYDIRHYIDTDPQVYLDYWRIGEANEYEYDGDVMTLVQNNALEAGESEFTFLVSGKADHTGGFHGDEMVTSIEFYIDGVQKTFSNSFELLPCTSFSYVVKSTLHETMDVGTPNTPIAGHPVIANHVKHTLFRDSRYIVKNLLEFTESFSIIRLYTGISCVGKIQALKGFNDYYESANFSGSSSHFLNQVNRREFYAQNESNNLSAFVTSKLLLPEEDDSLCTMFVWDRTNDSKYYRHTPQRTVQIGDIWKTEMEVIFS